MMSFPSFQGKNYENASYFLDDLEMAFLASRWDADEFKLKDFPLVMRDESKVWFQGLTVEKKADWATLKDSFFINYVTNKQLITLLLKHSLLSEPLAKLLTQNILEIPMIVIGVVCHKTLQTLFITEVPEV